MTSPPLSKIHCLPPPKEFKHRPLCAMNIATHCTICIAEAGSLASKWNRYENVSHFWINAGPARGTIVLLEIMT